MLFVIELFRYLHNHLLMTSVPFVYRHKEILFLSVLSSKPPLVSFQ